MNELEEVVDLGDDGDRQWRRASRPNAPPPRLIVSYFDLKKSW
jgi:hypothetical protein